MQNFNPSGIRSEAPSNAVPTSIEVRPLMRLVYLWMGFGLLTTGIVAFVLANNEQLLFSLAPLFPILLFVQLGIVLGLSFLINRVSPNVAGILFFIYAVSIGITFGATFYALTESGQGAAIYQAFFTTAGLFGAMTVVGFTTKVDLSRYSSFFMMALIGLVIAIVVNIFLGSSAISFIISVVGVLLFTALTAYDTQKIKQLAAMPEMQEHSDSMAKLAIMGALTLYLDFINIFIFLLQLFAGGGRD
jgi:uncharacterized protein